MIIYPTGETLPENVLRFHLVFDEPPNADVVHSAVRLLDEHGHEIPHAFLDLPQGLWDSTGRILTLLLHPGRIKSGLAASQALGLAVSHGSEVTLEVDIGAFNSTAQLSSTGSTIARKKYAITLAQTTGLDTDNWQITMPKVLTQHPLAIRTDHAIDFLSALSAVQIFDAHGVPQSASIEVLPGERTIYVHPSKPWQSDGWRLSLSSELEDICGNRVNQSFEQPDLAQTPAARAKEWELTKFLA
jgi:hypothetical protein